MSRYTMLWRNKFLTIDAKSLHDMIVILKGAVAELEAMRNSGKITLDEDSGIGDDYATLVTTDPKIAEEFGFEEEVNEEEDD